MHNNWRKFLDDDYEDQYEKTERIPHKPRREDVDKGKEINKIRPQETKKPKN